MPEPVKSTIAQILFEGASGLNYARIVAEMEQVLQRLKPDQLSVQWDCDDLVFFELAETRIALALAEFPHAAISACLTVSVGPRLDDRTLAADPGFDVLCSRIVERLFTRYQALAVLWTQETRTVDADLIDALTEALPRLDKQLPPIEGLVEPLWLSAARAEREMGAAVEERQAMMEPMAEPALSAAPPAAASAGPSRPRARRVSPLGLGRSPARPALAPRPANAAPPAVSVAPRSAELARLRDALYPAEPLEELLAENGQPLSTQMRLAVHAMNTTLILVYMPLGAAVVTYSLLKGENVKVSGRIMALTGTLLAFAQLPFLHSVASVVTGV